MTKRTLRGAGRGLEGSLYDVPARMECRRARRMLPPDAYLVSEQATPCQAFFEPRNLLTSGRGWRQRLDFGSWLVEKRVQVGISQRALAHKTGLSPAYIASLERGNSESPPFRTCKILARSLGLDPQEVWKRSFGARLKRWLKREGYARISEAQLQEIIRQIDSVAHEPIRRRNS